MAAKNKNSGKGAAATSGGSDEVERLLAKLRLKDAVHAAKLCYKSANTPEHHRLLERAYMLRSDQLRRGGMPAAAQQVAQHLLDFGVTDPALIEPAAELLRALGLSRAALALQGKLDTPEARESLAREEADQAVLHPERATQVSPEIHAGAEVVLAALKALQAGDEDSALGALRDVARSSPWSDWRLFVRGLAAFSRRELDAARANWDRLDPKRAASRIARSLIAISSGDGGSNAPVKLTTLETQVFGEPILDTFAQLRALLAQNRWDDAFRRIAWLRPRLLRIDPKLAERLTSVLLDPLILAVKDLHYDDAQEMLNDFTKAAQPLAIDPHWNRLEAIIWESQPGALEVVEEYWRTYLRDLETVSIFTPEERKLAQAMVWTRLGHEIGDSLDSGPPLLRNRPAAKKREEEELQKREIACYEQSLRLAPDYIIAYRKLLAAQRNGGHREEAAAVARRLLEHFPDDFDAIFFLGDYHFEREEPEPALEYALRARKLRPLDDLVANHEYAARLLYARTLAHQGRWDEGRAELAAAGLAWPEGCQSLHYKARQVIFELKAGQAERGEALILEIKDSLIEATPLWLALLIEAIRYKLPKAAIDRFDARWTNEQSRKRVRSETAGALAELMTPFLIGRVTYEGRDAHEKQVTAYLLRTTRIKYRLPDLIAVCKFLGLVPKAHDLLVKLVERGRKLYPKAPGFQVMAGTLEMEKGPFGGGRLGYAYDCFERALSLAKASNDPADARLVPEIQQQLSMVKDLTSGMSRSAFGGIDPRAFSSSGGPPGFSDLLEAMQRELGIDPFGDDDYDDDDDFDDDDDDDSGWGPPVFGRPSRPAPGPPPERGPRPKTPPKAKPAPKRGPRPKKG